MAVTWRKWAASELAVLDRVRPLYDARVTEFVAALKAGKRVRFIRSLGGDEAVLQEAGMYDEPSRLAVREAYVLGAILERVRQLMGRQPDAVRKFLSAADDVVLQRCGRWVSDAKTLDGVTIEEFAEGMRLFDVEHGRQLGVLLRSLLIVWLAGDEADGVSAVFPEHLLFPEWLARPPSRWARRGSKKAMIKELDKDIAPLVLDAIPLELAGAFLKLPGFIEEAQAKFDDNGHRGPYTLPRKTGYRWTFAPAQSAEKIPQFEELILPYGALIGEVLDYCLRARAAAMCAAGLSSAEAMADKNSNFALTATCYTVARQSITALAMYQLIAAWNASDGKIVPSTVLANRHGFKASNWSEPNSMRIEQNGSARIVRLGEKPPGWTSYLPLCAALLYRFFLAAGELTEG